MYLTQIYGKTYVAIPNVCKNWHTIELNGKKKMKAPTLHAGETAESTRHGLYRDFKRDL